MKPHTAACWLADIVISARHFARVFGISIGGGYLLPHVPLLPPSQLPELIPPQYHADVLYADSAELEQMAINAASCNLIIPDTFRPN